MLPSRLVRTRCLRLARRRFGRCRPRRFGGRHLSRCGIRISRPLLRVLSRPADHRSRAKRWNDAVAGLVTLQAEYAAWLESLPDNLQDTATAEVLRTICELDLSELQAIVPPRGFGRD